MAPAVAIDGEIGDTDLVIFALAQQGDDLVADFHHGVVRIVCDSARAFEIVPRNYEGLLGKRFDVIHEHTDSTIPGAQCSDVALRSTRD